MIVTKIEQLGKGRYQIYLDGVKAFILYRGELRNFKIEECEELSLDNYNKIMTEVLVKRSRLRAMNLLMKHSFTVRQLRNKLSDSGYPEEIIDNAVDYVKSYGYVDDKKYALEYIRCYNVSKSISRIKHDLISKGVDKDIILEAMEEMMSSEDKIDEEAQIKKLLIKKGYSSDMSYEDKQKICAYLSRKGYSTEKIYRTMKMDFEY